jgi:hypothetical protein
VCSAPEQTPELPPGTDLSRQTVVAGTVRAAKEPVGGAFVRLLDGTGEFTAEVVSSASGQFRFFTAPGSWTVRALHRTGNGEAAVTADGPGLYTVAVTVS